jgi:hypothetical protein
MRAHKSLGFLLSAAFTASLLLTTPALATDPVDSSEPVDGHQHGTDEGHLLGSGAWGKIELISSLELFDATDPAFGRELVADVGVDPAGEFAYLANWGFPDCALPESGGMTSPDAGIYVVDIRNLENPEQVAFIPTHQDTRPGEGVQVIEVTTSFFDGEILAFNHEGCGKNYKGGFSLWDVSDPTKPKRLATGVGDRTVDGSRRMISDANESHSVFMWDAGDRAYIVVQDEWESADVDIFDITNPRHPVLVSETDLNDFDVDQPDLDLTDSFLHDMIVKEIDGRFIMLLSYWDGGWVLLDVTDPSNPQFLGDTDYPATDPLLLEQTGIALPPEGNAHQAEFTMDNRFIIGTDEDFDPFKLFLTIGEGDPAPINAGTASGEGSVLAAGETITASTVFLGLACDAATIPEATADPEIAVVERGACDFQVKIDNAKAAGYDAVIIFNSTNGSPPCEALLNMLATVDIPSYFVARSLGYEILGIAGYDATACTGPALPAIGTAGETITLSSAFDGWGYVHLIDNDPASLTYLQSVDQYAIPEAHDPNFASGFGDLSVHEVAVDPQDPTLAYLSYYAGGLRAIQIECGDPTDASTCDLVEVGGYLDEEGNNFWGVETFVRDGVTYILASDRDSGLWIFKDP